jgi:hypothetical protein
MGAKDTVLGSAKRVVAEIVGDGRLAEEGVRQARGIGPSSAAATDVAAQQQRSPPTETHEPQTMPFADDDRFARLLGHAALQIWPNLPREAQERLFAAAVDDGIIANSLAVFLHNRHPRTAHPPKPKLLA